MFEFLSILLAIMAIIASTVGKNDVAIVGLLFAIYIKMMSKDL